MTTIEAQTSQAGITRERYLAQVRELLPNIRERAAATEQLGRIPDETIAELHEVGVLAGLQPRRWGGLELDPATFFEGVVLKASERDTRKKRGFRRRQSSSDQTGVAEQMIYHHLRSARITPNRPPRRWR